jgi:uncharacterized membrane protein HdeD (DUF308 family)
MTGREAEQTLSVIRTLMERSTTYTNLSGHAGIAAGLLALAGSALRAGLNTPFLPTWLGVLAAALATTFLFTARMAQRNGEPLWTRQSRTVFLSLLPALAGTLVLTAVLTRVGQVVLLPGVWMLMWGVGALAMSFFTPRVISMLGLTFMAAGVATFCLGPMPDALCMGATFGLVHLGYGVALTLAPQAGYTAETGVEL